MTTWKPATCGTTELDRNSCIIEFESQNFLVTCPAHNVVPIAQRFAALQDENSRGWANVWAEVLTIAPDAATKDSINLTWTWTGTAPNRVLTITVTGVTLNTSAKKQCQK